MLPPQKKINFILRTNGMLLTGEEEKNSRGVQSGWTSLASEYQSFCCVGVWSPCKLGYALTSSAPRLVYLGTLHSYTFHECGVRKSGCGGGGVGDPSLDQLCTVC